MSQFNKLKNIAITGFAPFANIDPNPSSVILDWVEPIITKRLEDLSNINITFIRNLPVDKDIILDAKLIEQFELIINIGVARNAEMIRIERQASNTFIDLSKDESCVDPTRPKNTRIELHGLPASLTNIDHVELGASGTIGNYVCNASFFWVASSGRGYFIHIPVLTGEQYEPFAESLATVIERLINLDVNSVSYQEVIA